MIRLLHRPRMAAALFVVTTLVSSMPLAAQPIADPSSDASAVVADVPASLRESFAYGGKFAFIRSADGTRLRYGQWSARGAQRGTIVLLGGRGEFIEKYAGELVGELTGRGFAVAALDWRGQGLSERKLADHDKGHVGDFAEYRDDLGAFLGQIVLPQAGAGPVIALAHSMGGHTVLRLLAEKPEIAKFDAAILAAPMTGLTNELPIRLALLFAPAGSRRDSDYMLGFGKFGETRLSFEQNRVTHDPRRYRYTDLWYQADPRLRVGGPTYGWLRAGLRSNALLRQDGYFKSVTVPILLLSAGQDQLVDSATHRRICAALTGCRLVRLPASKHEIMMETDPNRAIFWAEFDRFVAALAAR